METKQLIGLVLLAAVGYMVYQKYKAPEQAPSTPQDPNAPPPQYLDYPISFGKKNDHFRLLQTQLGVFRPNGIFDTTTLLAWQQLDPTATANTVIVSYADLLAIIKRIKQLQAAAAINNGAVS